MKTFYPSLPAAPAVLAAALLALTVVLTGCPGSNGDDPEPAAMDEPGEPHELMQALYGAIVDRDRNRFIAAFHGSDEQREVFKQLYEVIVRVDRLREAMVRRHGHSDAMVYQDGESSTQDLPGMNLHDQRWRQPGAVRDDDGELHSVQSPLWEQPLRLIEREGRWYVDAGATIDNSSMGAHADAATILKRRDQSLAEALDDAHRAYIRRGTGREAVLSDLSAAMQRIEIQTFRDYRALRDDRR